MTAGPHVVADVPSWLHRLAQASVRVPASALSDLAAPSGAAPREASVLMLFADGDGTPEGGSLVLLERSHRMRSHAGQIGFPGGARDNDDTNATATALRESEEEIALDRRGVRVLGVLPPLWLPPSNYEVTPVLAWWRTPGHIHAVDPAETASVHSVPLDMLLDPVNRVTIRHPSGYLGPAFWVGDLVVWGFTAGLMSRLFALAGWEQAWDVSRVIALPPHLVASSQRDLNRLHATS